MLSKSLVSPDAFRSFTVAAMIMVIFLVTAIMYFFTLKHSAWNGPIRQNQYRAVCLMKTN